jgi:hypothetical protein
MLALESMMTSNDDDGEDDAIWDTATMLSGKDTKDVKIHVTLRLDAKLYREIFAQKKAAHDRTITATIERLISQGLRHGTSDGERSQSRRIITSLVAHSAKQDAVLEMLSHHVKPHSENDRALLESLRSHRLPAETTNQADSEIPTTIKP